MSMVPSRFCTNTTHQRHTCRSCTTNSSLVFPVKTFEILCPVQCRLFIRFMNTITRYSRIAVSRIVTELKIAVETILYSDAERHNYTSILYDIATGPHEELLKNTFFQFTIVCFWSYWVPVLRTSSGLSATAALFCSEIRWKTLHGPCSELLWLCLSYK